MKSLNVFIASFLFFLIMLANISLAQNPIIKDQFTADPTARVFDGKVYLYPSHDIRANEERGRIGWFCMEDYHVFSSDDLIDWTDHGVIVHQEKVPWTQPDGYAMWAPDCISKNGKYYFYFPSPAKDTTLGRGFFIGVAVADKPYGPFTPETKPIGGVRGIDPNVFVDDDGQAYLYWSARNFYVAKLKDNMTELASEPISIEELPQKGMKEGPFLFKRDDLYYLTYPHVENETERLEYAIGKSPVGPFEVKGVIMDEAPNGCWTNHHSVIEFKDQWYLFYHRNDLSPSFDKNRAVRIDSLFFNEDGTIKKVMATYRGVGVTKATSKIQIDRYTGKSDGVSVMLHDTTKTFDGWKTEFESANDWIKYNSVDFGNGKLSQVKLRTISESGGLLEIREGNVNGALITKIELPNGNKWEVIESTLSAEISGIKNIVVVSKQKGNVKLDWISFN